MCPLDKEPQLNVYFTGKIEYFIGPLASQDDCYTVRIDSEEWFGEHVLTRRAKEMY